MKISMTSNVLPLHFAPSQASSSQNSFKWWQLFAILWSWFLEMKLIWVIFKKINTERQEKKIQILLFVENYTSVLLILPPSHLYQETLISLVNTNFSCFKMKLPAREAVTSFAKTSLLNEIQISFRCNCMATWRMENKENSPRAKIVATPQIPATFIQAEKNEDFVNTLIACSMVSIKCPGLNFPKKILLDDLV